MCAKCGGRIDAKECIDEECRESSRESHDLSGSNDEGRIWSNVSIGHARSVESETGIAMLVEKDDAASSLPARGEELNGLFGGEHGGRVRLAERIRGSFGHHDTHDGLAISGGRSTASFGIGIAATTDEGRIADAAGEFAANASGGGGGEEAALFVDGDSADGALVVTAMVLGSVRVFAAAKPGFVFGGRDKIGGSAKRKIVLGGEALGTLANKHHMRALFEDAASEANRILDAMKTGNGTGFECGRVHDDGVAFHPAIEIEVRAVTCIKNRIVFENGDSGFDGVQSVTV